MTTPPKYEDLVLKVAEMDRRETALRGSLTDKRDEYNKLGDRYDAIQQRLTVAEQRVDLLEGLLKSGSSPTYAHCSAVMEALKPAADPELDTCRTIVELFPDSPGGYYNGCPLSALSDPMQCWRDGYEMAKKRAIAAGLKVKP